MPPSDYNAAVIAEFRANAGRIASRPNDPLLLLTTTGRRTGRPHTTPLMYLDDGDRIAVFASKGGAPTNPDWYHNLVSNPAVTVELGADTLVASAEVIRGTERDELFARQVERFPMFGEYQANTERRIPVIALRPRAP